MLQTFQTYENLRKESDFELDAGRGVSAFAKDSNNMETQTNFNIVDYEEQSDRQSPPRLSITQSFHNAHNIHYSRTADESELSQA